MSIYRFDNYFGWKISDAVRRNRRIKAYGVIVPLDIHSLNALLMSLPARRTR